jgi:isocitrate/isopropylmalate dehydrogenase
VTEPTAYSVACLSGHGIAPEVMAEASRALARVAQLHGFRVREAHPAFGGEARTQSGHALPPATRRATLGAQAILVAAASDTALADIESELDLQARLERVAFGRRGTLTVVSPLSEGALDWTVERAFAIARSSKARVTCVGGDARWGWLVGAAAARNDGVRVDELPVGTAVQRLTYEPEAYDVVLTPSPFADAVVALAAHAHSPRIAASARLSSGGPSIFSPTHGAEMDIAGQGVANPASMLLAASLMLGEGLGEHRAAETLEGAVLEASANGVRTPDQLRVGIGATTREFADVVLAKLPLAMTNAEFYREAIA